MLNLYKGLCANLGQNRGWLINGVDLYMSLYGTYQIWLPMA